MSSFVGGRVLLLGALVAAAVAGRGDAARLVSRPPGTPDLAQMAIRASDLPGARVRRQGYVKPDQSDVASYKREFALFTVKIGSKRLLGLESDVNLERSVADAKLYISLVPLAVLLLDPKELADSAPSNGLHPTYVRISNARRIRVGDQAYEVTIRIGTKVGEMRAFMVFVQVNRVIDFVFAMGVPRATVGLREAAALATLTARHSHDGLLPINTSPPVVTGTAALGQTLTATPGVWSNKPSSFTYAWQRCDAAGAACTYAGGGPTYTVTTADGGSTLRVQVTARNSVGTGNAVSPATAVVAGPPVSTEPPTIAGTPAVGQALTATTGTWSGNPASFVYQWQRCDQAGAGCAAVAGATAQTYTVTASDIGSTLRVAVTATNANGSTLAVSSPTAIVTD